MRPFQTLDAFETPDGHRLTLHHRDGDYFIDLDGRELMSTRVHDSETALGERAAAQIVGRPGARLLIGGLGLGFTLRAALEGLGDDAEVVVAELFEIVVGWHRDQLAGLGVPLDDPRVDVRIGGVTDLLGGRERWDAVALDTDNAPDAACLSGNESLYDAAGVARIKGSLRPGGVLAVWSAHPDHRFEKRLCRAGFSVRTESVRGHRGKGPRHTLFLARA